MKIQRNSNYNINKIYSLEFLNWGELCNGKKTYELSLQVQDIMEIAVGMQKQILYH